MSNGNESERCPSCYVDHRKSDRGWLSRDEIRRFFAPGVTSTLIVVSADLFNEGSAETRNRWLRNYVFAMLWQIGPIDSPISDYTVLEKSEKVSSVKADSGKYKMNFSLLIFFYELGLS